MVQFYARKLSKQKILKLEKLINMSTIYSLSFDDKYLSVAFYY